MTIKIGHYIISKKAILHIILGCFGTGIIIGANIAANVLSAPIVFLFIIPIWLPLIKGIRDGISKENQA
ncbi:hypothetical protein DWB61_10770 [Ancylomarina euxinus]|uniref:Uncharacterized protein n=1 Tax=Ancylomarina euxinus TaxID=2283627 RepID=A0A425Y0V9_9BACT|nr:hypothetical protein [Ancylomarina euxinus]MCZ4695308.1 hypothetical protein [Ancylomarina euxinus]MUP15503.1 hypothetical protein [Ancylomarina euxinus]RRG21210.1 hypothetical protein DWB61_10770 [Ancylomarina euxinus]